MLTWPSIMRPTLSALGLAAWVLAMFPACGGPTFDGHVYRGKEFAFRVGPLPENWRAIDAEGTLLAFDGGSGRTVAVNGRCGVDGDDVPLNALTHHLFLNFTQRNVLEQKSVELDRREALRTELSANLDGVPKHFVVYVLKKDGCVFDFMWIGSPEESDGNIASFDRFVRGFSTNI